MSASSGPISAPSRRHPLTERHRLIVVSNRLPVTLRRTAHGIERRRSTGGLVAAMDPVLEGTGGLWLGWTGSSLRRVKLSEKGDPYRIVPIRLTPADVRLYYYGCSNAAIWPLFHSFPTLSQFDRRHWQAYEDVNARFARAAARVTEPGDVFWIHDYQLMRMSQYLREQVPDAPIGFFLHIPFPPSDVFRLIPWEEEILRGMLAADLLGFHVGDYARNFLDCTERVLGARVDRANGLVEFEDRTTEVGAFPLGIDYERFDLLARAGPLPREDGSRLILGVDRLDYTKGIPQRIKAFERLLETHPEHREKVVFLQVTPPSREEVPEYRLLKEEIEKLVGRVTGRFATAEWVPIRYLARSLPPERLAVLYRDAEVALVTPLRDGMNLVAKEYVASQVAHPGVLILSRMTGASETMLEALQVNPYDLDGTAEALHRALTMPEEERERRMTALRERERVNNVHAWATAFLERLLVATGRNAR